MKKLRFISLIVLFFALPLFFANHSHARPLANPAVSLQIESISGPDQNGAYTIKGSAVPSGLRPDPNVGYSNYLSVYAEFMVGDGQWPVYYEFYSIGWSCNAIGERCLTEEEDQGVNVSSSGLVATNLEYSDDGVTFPFDAQITPPEGATQMRIVARLEQILHGNPWDAYFYRWADYGPQAVESIPTPEATLTPDPAVQTGEPDDQGEITDETTGDSATVTPPVQGAPIVVRAFKDGYGEATQTIQNEPNFEAIIIEGRVTDQEGNGVGDAIVEVVSGANTASTYTNADGTYSLAISVNGGLGNGYLSGVGFTLQLEGDLTIAKIHLLQAVSGAELADSKSTAALVFPRFSSQAQSSLETKISLYVNGQFFTTVPFRVKSDYTADDHRKVFDAAKFFIPPSFVRSGPFEVKAVIDPENTFLEPDENNNEKTWSEVVSPSKGMSLLMVALSPNITTDAAQAWGTDARRFLANTYPVPAVRVVKHPVYANGWLSLVLSLRDVQITNNALVAYNNANPETRAEFAAGLVPRNTFGTGTRGLIYRRLYPQASLIDRQFPVTIAHEIGHVYLGGHEEVDDDPNLGGVSLPEGYIYNAIKGQIRYLRPNSNWINFMGDPYAGFEEGAVTVFPWISPTASDTILSARKASAPSLKSAARTLPNWTSNAPFEKVLYFSGYFDYGELQALPPLILDTSEVREYPTGDYLAEMRADDGSVLANASFEVSHELGEYDAPNPGSFQVEIPYPDETARFVITKDGQEFYRLEKSASSPTVSVAQPGGGSPVDAKTAVTWSASDGDGDTLTYNVYYSPDGGTTWQLVGLGLSDPTQTLDGALLSGSDSAILRVVASDGLNTGQADSPPFVVPKHPPTVSILPPDAEAEPWVEGHPNLLAATGEDIEDGWLPPESFQWSSDKDGVLGSGNALYAALTKGKHTITVTATDSDGQQTTAATTVSVSGVGFYLPVEISNILSNSYYLIGGAICLGLVILMIVFGIVVMSWSRRRARAVSAPSSGRSQSVQDSQGRWWYVDRSSGNWHLWNGNSWQAAPPGVAPDIQSPVRPQTSGPRRGGSCLLSLLVSALLGLIVAGGISLVAFNFFPPHQIEIGQGDPNQILTLGGGGLLISVLGFFLLNGGFKAILTRRAVVEDEWGRRREQRGCGAILTGVGQLFFGLLLFAGGLGLLTLAFYQEILPWLGF